MSARLTAIAIAVLVTAAPAMAQTPERPIGDIQVFATLPYPGHPGGLAVAGRTLYVDTSNADFDRPFDASDEIWAFNLDSGQPAGGLRSNPIEVAREASVQTMGLLGMALDSQGRIYAADMNGRIVRVDPRTGAQQVYATIPTSTDTSFTDMPGFPVFGRDGNLYVGDWSAPVIWRVPPGGGQAQPWFADPRLAGTYGANVAGIALDPSGEELYIAAGTQEGQIAVYRLPLAHPDAAQAGGSPSGPPAGSTWPSSPRTSSRYSIPTAPKRSGSRARRRTPSARSPSRLPSRFPSMDAAPCSWRTRAIRPSGRNRAGSIPRAVW